MKNTKRYYDRPGNVYFDDHEMRDLYMASAGLMRFSMPYVNVMDKDDRYEIRILSPGIDLESIEVGVEQGQLVIISKGNKNKTFSPHLLKEFSIPGYVRTIQLPQRINIEQVDYELDKGVLNVYVKK